MRGCDIHRFQLHVPGLLYRSSGGYQLLLLLYELLQARNSAQEKVKQGKNGLAQRGQPPLTVSGARPDPAMYLNLCATLATRVTTGRESALQVVTAALTR